MTILMWLIGAVFVVVGLLGTVLPILPGAMLIYAGLFIAAWADGFTRVGPVPLAVCGIIAILSYAVDFVAGALGGRRAGASTRAMAGAALGTLAGLFLGLPGILLGPFIGAVAGELTVHDDLRQAGRVGLATWMGLALGAVAKVAFAFVMIAVFLTALVF